MIRNLLGAKASEAMKLVKIMGYISGYAAEAALIKTRVRDRDERLRLFSENVGKWSARALQLMNLEVKVVGFNSEMMAKRNFLMVSNHMSYIDILVLSSVLPSVFVTSVDMGETAFLGQMAELGGSLFIERRHRGHIERDLGSMADVLRAGHQVVIYPEGTSTNGQAMLPFKKALLMSAVRAERDILPLCLKFVEIDGEPFSLSNTDKICWYGDMAFAPHFLSLLKRQSVKAELHFLDPIPVRPDSTRHELAEKAFNAVYEAYTGSAPKEMLVSEAKQETSVRLLETEASPA